uniref:Uncharacterized protein n=1 Tax=Oryza nivara TaxID=4536 RepID=A0A0E0G8T6_ORYNI
MPFSASSRRPLPSTVPVRRARGFSESCQSEVGQKSESPKFISARCTCDYSTQPKCATYSPHGPTPQNLP